MNEELSAIRDNFYNAMYDYEDILVESTKQLLLDNGVTASGIDIDCDEVIGFIDGRDEFVLDIPVRVGISDKTECNIYIISAKGYKVYINYIGVMDKEIIYKSVEKYFNKEDEMD